MAPSSSLSPSSFSSSSVLTVKSTVVAEATIPSDLGGLGAFCGSDIIGIDGNDDDDEVDKEGVRVSGGGDGEDDDDDDDFGMDFLLLARSSFCETFVLSSGKS